MISANDNNPAAFASDSFCARCAKRQQTCCQRTRIVITAGDVERIAAETGRDGFFEHMRVAERQIPGAETHDALWREILAAPDGCRVVRRDDAGNCFFLGDGGCTLSERARPLLCRLYPFDYTAQTIKGVYGPLCPEPERDNPPMLLALLSMNREQAESWRRQLYLELAVDLSH